MFWSHYHHRRTTLITLHFQEKPGGRHRYLKMPIEVKQLAYIIGNALGLKEIGTSFNNILTWYYRK